MMSEWKWKVLYQTEVKKNYVFSIEIVKHVMKVIHLTNTFITRVG